MAVMVCAYCDESEDVRYRVFTITAVLGGGDNWYDPRMLVAELLKEVWA